MTVALLLAAAPDRLTALAHPNRRPGDRLPPAAPWLDYMGDRLMSAGVRQVDVAMCADAADGLRALALTARDTGEPVLVCTSARALATPGESLAALLGGAGTAALPAGGALLVARADLPAVAAAAEALAGRLAAGGQPRGRRRLSLRRVGRRTGVSGDLDGAVGSLIEFLAGHGVRVTALDSRNGASPPAPTPGPHSRPAAPEPGLVAGLVVAPLASRLARLFAARGLPPGLLTVTALALSACAAAWFAAGTRSSLLTGSLLLCAALPLRQAHGWLPERGTPSWPASGWLATLAAVAGEYAVYAGLAIGWAAGRPRQAWAYATAAAIVLAVRQMTDACYAALAGSRSGPGRPEHPGRREPSDHPGRRLLRLAGQSITLPSGERALLIAVAAAVWGPRAALAALTGWGVVALGYVLAERAVASGVPAPAGHGASPEGGVAGIVAAARDDGPLASWLGSLVRGQLPPLLPAFAGVMVTGLLAALGLRDLPGPLLLAPPVAMLLAALGAQNPHTGRFDWLVPPLLQAGEYAYLAAATLPAGVPPAAVFALIAVIALHHIDLLDRRRRGMLPPRVAGAGLGWEGRMLVVGFGGMLGIEAVAGTALAVYLWAVFGWDGLTSWPAVAPGPGAWS